MRCKDHLNSQYTFFGRIFVTVSVVEIFNVIRYANNTMCDITLRNECEIACFVVCNNRK